MLVWPDCDHVDQAVRRWAEEESRRRPETLRRLGYFGSYARGDWGVGSDLDLVAIVTETPEPFDRRALEWNLTTLPVPAEILVYTEAEWQALTGRGGRFAQTLEREVVWVAPEPRARLGRQGAVPKGNVCLGDVNNGHRTLR